ncbi:S ribonuclease [Pyrus ussuriensis x Pyrus communis]|uniref:S ribonuclease n=1 Tax=Pyrus ussuriensis x Pyrus communis TaxID=2448454 RepID=A0A5N5FTL9_9ROSA|nr:S ribonuclease [Pyrus ussuriensis x Pyrus communis]
MGENVAAIMKSGAGNAKVSWKGKGMHGKLGKLVESWKWDGLCTALSLFGCMCM